MSSKTAAILEKVRGDRERRNYAKALKRVTDAIGKMPDDLDLYQAGVDVALEAGESLTAQQFVRQAQKRFPDHEYEIWTQAVDRVRKFNDANLARSLMEVAIKKRDLESAMRVSQNLKDHTAGELLRRIRTKKQSLSNTADGGFAFKGELIVYALAEALLCIRVNKFQESSKCFIKILEHKPIEHVAILAFFLDLEKKFPKKSGIVYTLGCCYLAGEHFGKALAKMVQGATVAPSFAEDAAYQIGALYNKPGVSTEEILLALGKLALIRGDIQQASDKLREVLEKNPNRSGLVLDLLEPHAESTDDPALQYLYAETAVTDDRTDRVLGMLRRIYSDGGNREHLFAWLAEVIETKKVAPEVLKFYGEVALDERMFPTAVSAYKQLLERSPFEIAAVREAIAPHRTEAELREFYLEVAEQSGSLAEHDGFEIHHLGSNRFSLDSDTDDPREHITSVDNTGERLTESEDTVGSALEGTSMESSTRGDDLLSLETPFDVDTSAEPERTPQPVIRKDSAAWEEVVGDRRATLVADEPVTAETRPSWRVVGPQRMQQFRTGAIDNATILDSIDIAMTSGDMRSARELLTFRSETLAEEIRRKLYLADFYTLAGAPLPALITLRTIRPNVLSKEERQTFLLKIANCYESLNQYDAAHSTYLRILSEHPGFLAAQRLAKVNYLKYLRAVTGGAAILEKVTSV